MLTDAAQCLADCSVKCQRWQRGPGLQPLLAATGLPVHDMPRVSLFCAACRSPLLRYNNKGGGALVKLHPDRVDRTVGSAGVGENS